MVSIIEKATNKVVVSSISASKLEEYGHHRMFILNHQNQIDSSELMTTPETSDWKEASETKVSTDQQAPVK